MKNLLFVATVAVTAGVPVSALAQSEPVAHRPIRATTGSAIPRLQTLAALGGAALAQGRAPGDPVSDGIAYGALIGAASGLAVMAYLYNLCDGSCDAPEPVPMYLAAAGMGAAVGAVAGWAVDAARRNSASRIAVGAVLAPKRQSVAVAVLF